MTDYDIVLLTDCKLPGGTAASVAEEIKAQSRFGYRTALAHVPSRIGKLPKPFNPRLTEAVERGFAHLLIDPTQAVTTTLAIARHPTVFESPPTTLPPITSAHSLLVVNQSPIDDVAAGQQVWHYDPAATKRVIDQLLGPDTTWIPIGPKVRRSFEHAATGIDLAPSDWHNIIDVDEWHVDRTAFPRQSTRPVIGRHGRDHADKWPVRRADILAAYPADGSVVVRVLGGADRVAPRLGGVPEAWTVFEYGTMTPKDFLADLDFFVYFHAPGLVEAFGRTILEALAAGVPAIVDESFRELFGDACIYATPDTARDVIARYVADVEAYRAQASRGQEFARQNFGYESHDRRLRELMRDSAPERPRVVPRVEPEVPTATARKTRIMFASSNGVGVGHLMRMMSIARRASDDVEAFFFTLSQAVPIVRKQGYLVEYMASAGYSKVAIPHWHPMLRQRLGQAIDRYEPDAVVFDGTWPWDGLVDAATDHPNTKFIWSRRGMWRETVTRHRLDAAPAFDAIIEPGELASAYDRGPTVPLRHQAAPVGPITFLRPDEMLPRQEARAELGLPPGGVIGLIHLGAGNIDDTTSLTGRLVEAMRDNDVEVVLTKSVISQGASVPAGVHTLSIYPLAKYLNAFDFGVAAPGYNTFHEFVLGALPTAFSPNLETLTDDQEARARWAEDQGVGLYLRDDTEIEVARIVTTLLDSNARKRMAETAQALGYYDGAAQAVDAILATVAGTPVSDTNPVTSGVATRGDVATTEASTSTPMTSAATPDPVVLANPTSSVPLSVRLYRSSTARGFVNWLPDTMKAFIRRHLRRRWRAKGITPARARGHAGGPRLHPGRLLTEFETDVALRLGFLLLLSARDDVEWIVERLAHEQVLRRSFAPLFFTTRDDLDLFRKFEFQLEYLAPPSDFDSFAVSDWESYREERLTWAAEVFQLDAIHVITPQVIHDDGLWRAFCAALPAQSRTSLD